MQASALHFRSVLDVNLTVNSPESVSLSLLTRSNLGVNSSEKVGAVGTLLLLTRATFGLTASERNRESWVPNRYAAARCAPLWSTGGEASDPCAWPHTALGNRRLLDRFIS